MANLKTYSVRLSDLEIKALEFLQKEFTGDARETGMTFKYSRSDVIRALVWIQIRERADAEGKSVSELLDLGDDDFLEQ